MGRIGRALPSVTSFGPLGATLRVLRLNPHEKQMLHAYTKKPQILQIYYTSSEQLWGQAVWWLQTLPI